jgi:hypothetical protein
VQAAGQLLVGLLECLGRVVEVLRHALEALDGL